MRIYHYKDDTLEYIGDSIAKLSPLDAKQGRQVYLLPKNATSTPPPFVGNSETTEIKWDKINKTWVVTPKKKIVLLVNKEVDLESLLLTLKRAFQSEIYVSGDIHSKASRNLIFDGIENTENNKEKLQRIVDEHDARERKSSIESLSKLDLACYKVLLKEIRKALPSFPDVSQFSDLVKDEYLKD